MPKLFQINTVANWGSTGRIAEGIGEAAMKRGWECWMAYGRGNPTSKMHLVRVGHQYDMYINALKTRIFDNEGLSGRMATKRLIEEMRRVDPDVVHLHNIHGYYLNFPLLFTYLAEADIPVVWTLHDCWSFTGHCVYFDYAGCQRWKSGCHHCPQKRESPASLLFDRSKRNYELKHHYFTLPRRMTIVPVSDWLAGLIKQSFLSKYPICRIYNGVDLQRFRPMQGADVEVRSKYDIHAPHFLLGVASTWSRRKGLADFIALREELPREDYDIVLLGLTKKQIRQLPENIIGVERTNSVEEMAQLYSAAAAFVNPTWEDNFPTTNIEALACGTPVVTYRTGGSVEAADDITGRVVEQGDRLALAAAIRSIVENTDRGVLRHACRERAERLYDKNERFAEYVEMYEQLMVKRKEILIGGGKFELNYKKLHASLRRAERRVA